MGCISVNWVNPYAASACARVLYTSCCVQLAGKRDACARTCTVTYTHDQHEYTARSVQCLNVSVSKKPDLSASVPLHCKSLRIDQSPLLTQLRLARCARFYTLHTRWIGTFVDCQNLTASSVPPRHITPHHIQPIERHS